MLPAVAGKPKPEAQRTKTRSISLVPRHWAVLDALGAELGYLRGETSGTTSEAVRDLIVLLLREYQKHPERLQRLPVDGEDRTFLFFITGKTAGGEQILRRVELETGATETVIRWKSTNFDFVHDKVEQAPAGKPKKKPKPGPKPKRRP